MYINSGLSKICRRVSNQVSKDLYREELSKLLCLYVGKQDNLDSKVKELLIQSTKLFLDESICTGQPLLLLFGEWLDNGDFRTRCLHERELINKGSGILEVYPHECVEVPVLQLIYEKVDWSSDIPQDILNMSNYTAIKNVGKKLESIYKSS